jgi:hypothetical protein
MKKWLPHESCDGAVVQGLRTKSQTGTLGCCCTLSGTTRQCFNSVAQQYCGGGTLSDGSPRWTAGHCSLLSTASGACWELFQLREEGIVLSGWNQWKCSNFKTQADCLATKEAKLLSRWCGVKTQCRVYTVDQKTSSPPPCPPQTP